MLATREMSQLRAPTPGLGQFPQNCRAIEWSASDIHVSQFDSAAVHGAPADQTNEYSAEAGHAIANILKLQSRGGHA